MPKTSLALAAMRSDSSCSASPRISHSLVLSSISPSSITVSSEFSIIALSLSPLLGKKTSLSSIPRIYEVIAITLLKP